MRLIHHEQQRLENIILRGEVHAYDDKEQYEAYKIMWENAGFTQLFATKMNETIYVVYTRVTEIKGAGHER